jgi:tetratricopeptide (TPR) repeat protein|tara:strand:- start:5507 stop:6700 length:1194 start_codon:yes stop_codon:yes gene_type:complete
MNSKFTLIILICSCVFYDCQEKTDVDANAARFLLVAEDAFRQGSYNAALILTDSARSYSTDLADIYFLRGRVFTKLNRLDRAEQAYQKVVSIDPDYEGARFNLGSISFRRGELAEAIEHYRIEQDNHPSARVLVQIGRAYAGLGEVDNAVIAYEEAIDLDDKFAAAYMRLGHLFKDSGEIDRALDYATKGQQLEPENLDYKYFLGSLLLLTGHPEKSLPYLRQIIAHRPWHYWANHNLGQALFRVGKEEEGKRYMKTAEGLQESIQEVENWRSLAEMNPDQLMLWVNLSNALRRMGRVDEALEALLIALSLDPANLALQNNIANLNLMSGDTVKAIFRYEAILSRDSSLVDIWLNLGAVYASAGRTTEARTAWQNGLKYDPDHVTIKEYLETLPRDK